MAGFVPGERGRVVRVIDGDALVLDTGQSVRLVSIEAPAPARRNRDGEPFAREARRMLEDMALGRMVRLYYPGLSRDRYDRALAHARTIDTAGPDHWLNMQLVARGGARVRVYPDTARGAEPLFVAEASAREARAGLWALAAYAIPRASEVAVSRRGFVILEGVLGEPGTPEAAVRRDTGRQPAACIRPLLDSPVRLEMTPSAVAGCAFSSGLWVRARGYLRDGRLDITHQLNLTVLERTGRLPPAAAL